MPIFKNYILEIVNLSVEIIKNISNDMKLFLFEDEFPEHR
jgi:hypothetical protein